MSNKDEFLKLDPRKPYASVHGSANHRYEQNHCFYNHAGDRVDENGNLVSPAAAAAKPMPPKIEESKEEPVTEDAPEPMTIGTPRSPRRTLKRTL